jgi:PadR family transcriptional regulator, regulatory protein PadR
MGSDGLGEFEQLILLAVVRCADEAYAGSVRDEMETRTARTFSRGAVHVTLDRLERKGYLRSVMGSPTAERGGKAKRLFTITAAGRKTLQASLEGIEAMRRGLGADLRWSTES